MQVKRITIETIEHKQQRYDTVGDWLYDEATGTVTIFVSDMGDWRMNMCCGIHEAVETLLCVQRGIKEEDVSAFDVQFEADRQAGKHGEDDEPGEAIDAPYRKEHAVADVVERLLAVELDLAWASYNDALYSLNWYEGRS
jgi:hypothetical protein